MKKKNTAKKARKRTPAKRRPAAEAALIVETDWSPVVQELNLLKDQIMRFDGKFLAMQASMAHLESQFFKRSPTEHLFKKIEHAAKDLQSYGLQYENGARMLNQAMGEFRDGPIRDIEEKLRKLGVSE